ncbi:Isochorismatase domain-containing protein [Mycena indigotica]|uniref:Isochorismatase domain-containing protein n=1 Tax=Mycena indigotica TaxID=2126181 RepID=A0A8H6T6A6_9AGAR|nr:Isochorismatase domain-containing protein [Mycena indigotica]KAF7311736.1 Isochorismatase domain-containing protein [Mycena indigotica]
MSTRADDDDDAQDGLRTVLLLLNVQHGLVADARTRIHDGPAVLENIRRVLAAARAAGTGAGEEEERGIVTGGGGGGPRIVHVRNAGDAGDPDELGTPGWELVLHDRDGSDELVVDKRKNNAFAGTELGRIVAPEAEIVVVGVMSEYSVKSTVKAALARGNTVILMKGAHGTYDHVALDNDGNVTRADTIVAEIEEELDRAGAVVLDMEFLPNLFEGR